MGLFQCLFGPSKEVVWQELSRQIGAEYERGGMWKGSKVTAKHGPWEITLDTYTVSTGKSSATFTRIQAPFINRDDLRFHVYRSSIFSKIAVFLGMQDLKLGIPEFDDKFIIKSNQPQQVKRLLDDPALRALFEAQPKMSLAIEDDEGFMGKDFPERVDQLCFRVHGVIRDIEQLKGLFELFATTLERLCEIGSAYQAEPFEHHDVPDADILLRPSNAQTDTLLRPAGAVEVDTANLLRTIEESTPQPSTEVSQVESQEVRA